MRERRRDDSGYDDSHTQLRNGTRCDDVGGSFNEIRMRGDNDGWTECEPSALRTQCVSDGEYVRSD